MPPFGYLLKGIDFKDIKIHLQHEVKDAAGKVTTPDVSINLGNFIQVSIEFLIIAFTIFMVLKMIDRMKRKEAETPPAPAAPAPPSPEVQLLTEIRDELKKKQ